MLKKLRKCLFSNADDSLTDKMVLRSFAREETYADNSGWYLHSVHLGGREGHRIFETFLTAIKKKRSYRELYL